MEHVLNCPTERTHSRTILPHMKLCICKPSAKNLCVHVYLMFLLVYTIFISQVSLKPELQVQNSDCLYLSSVDIEVIYRSLNILITTMVQISQ